MTVYKQQLLLEYLGFSPGPLDGLDGQKTRAAAKKFQTAYGLEADGICGTGTEKALKDAVAGLIEPVGVNIDTDPEEGDWWKNIRYFRRSEFACKCGGKYCNGFPAEPKEAMVRIADQIREHFGSPARVISGLRCPAHNSSPTVGGATGSRHIKGDAADIVVKGVAPRTVAQYAESIGIKGIGLYETSKDGYFVHIDTRDYKSFWYGKACAARSTFGGVISDGATVTASEDKNQMLSIGSRGSAVLELQESLAILGYQIETDGIYGPKTQSTVRDYQSKNGLTVDGIAGTLTRKSITDAVSKKDATSDGYVVHVKASVLNIRKGPGTNYAIAGTIRDKGAYKISAESSGLGASKWGRLADGRGWISLDYCTS